jgi:spermidine synthase
MSDNRPLTPYTMPLVYESISSRVMLFSMGETQSSMRLNDPLALDLEYTRTMMGFLMLLPEPRSIGMVGLGGGSLAKFCHRYLPHAQVQVMEINPHVIALRKEFHVPDNDDRFEVISANGALFIRNRQAAYDVLLIDGYDIHGLPAELTSQRFYDDCHAALGVDGIMVANLYYGHHDYQAQLDRIQRAFQGRILVVNDGEMSNSIVFACKGERLRKKGIGLIRRPKGLEAKAADHLLGAFARIATAQQYQWW